MGVPMLAFLLQMSFLDAFLLEIGFLSFSYFILMRLILDMTFYVSVGLQIENAVSISEAVAKRS